MGYFSGGVVGSRDQIQYLGGRSVKGDCLCRRSRVEMSWQDFCGMGRFVVFGLYEYWRLLGISQMEDFIVFVVKERFIRVFVFFSFVTVIIWFCFGRLFILGQGGSGEGFQNVSGDFRRFSGCGSEYGWVVQLVQVFRGFVFAECVSQRVGQYVGEQFVSQVLLIRRGDQGFRVCSKVWVISVERMTVF